MTEPNKPKVKLMHTQEPDRFGNIYIHVQLYGPDKTDKDFMQSNYCKRYNLLVGRKRFKLRLHVLQIFSDRNPFSVYATVRHNDWQFIQDRFGKPGKPFIKIEPIVIAYKRIS